MSGPVSSDNGLLNLDIIYIKKNIKRILKYIQGLLSMYFSLHNVNKQLTLKLMQTNLYNLYDGCLSKLYATGSKITYKAHVI